MPKYAWNNKLTKELIYFPCEWKQTKKKNMYLLFSIYNCDIKICNLFQLYFSKIVSLHLIISTKKNYLLWTCVKHKIRKCTNIMSGKNWSERPKLASIFMYIHIYRYPLPNNPTILKNKTIIHIFFAISNDYILGVRCIYKYKLN